MPKVRIDKGCKIYYPFKVFFWTAIIFEGTLRRALPIYLLFSM